VADAPAVRFRDLVNLTGVQDLFPDVTAEQAEALSARASNLLADDPDLGDVHVVRGADHYSHEADTIGLDKPHPDILSHEAGHAQGIGRAGGVYKNLVRLSNQSSRINQLAAIPASLSIRALTDSTAAGNSVLAPLAGISALLASPGLYEETRATVKAVGKSPDKMKTFGQLLPPLIEHYAHGLAAPAVYLGQILASKED
jgi:hypothetical protein